MTQHDITKILGYLLFALIILFAIYYVKHLKKKSGRKLSCNTGDLNPEHESWVDDFMDGYYKKMLAYYILSLVREYNLPYRQEKELTQKYGTVVTRPILLIYAEFPKRFGHNVLIKPLIRNWLGNNYTESIDVEKQAETLISKRAEKQAQEIIKEISDNI